MKSGKVILLARLLLMCLLTVNTFAESKSGPGNTRIRFKRGASSATVTGKLTSRRLRQFFLVAAKAGQVMYVEVRARTDDELDFANFIISDPSGKGVASDDGGSARIRLEQTGDYQIKVTPSGRFYREKISGYKQLQFTLSVRIE
jgi:hypothetical protein